MRGSLIYTCLSFSIVWLLSACGGLQTYHRVLYPSQTAQDCKTGWDVSDEIYCAGEAEMGLVCDSAAGEKIPSGKLLEVKTPVVGYHHRYDSGTEPAPCWEYANSVSRAYVNFDLKKAIPKIEKVVVAKLTWDPSKHAGSNQPPYCFKKLYEATGPWKTGATPGNLITDELDQPQPAKSIFISEVVKKWAKAGGAQFGLFFTATKEALNYKNNSSCETALNSLLLEVTYLGKQEKWPQ